MEVCSSTRKATYMAQLPSVAHTGRVLYTGYQELAVAGRTRFYTISVPSASRSSRVWMELIQALAWLWILQETFMGQLLPAELLVRAPIVNSWAVPWAVELCSSYHLRVGTNMKRVCCTAFVPSQVVLME